MKTLSKFNYRKVLYEILEGIVRGCVRCKFEWGLERMIIECGFLLVNCYRRLD